jgi:murein DD-endopeptidase MepM/ murein hydrolase activator NlpD
MKFKIFTFLLSIVCFILYFQLQEAKSNINTVYQEKDYMEECFLYETEMYETYIDTLEFMLNSLPLGSPLDTLILSDDYGPRKNPLTRKWQFHKGCDYLAAWHDTVYAAGNGIVSKAKWYYGYGRCITINHVDGYQSWYAHLHRMFVSPGDTVIKGQPIGRAGNSGAVTGPHLHYEIRKNKEHANPEDYIKN